MAKCPLGGHCPECQSHRRNSPGTFVTPEGHKYCENDWHTHTFDGQTWHPKTPKVTDDNGTSKLLALISDLTDPDECWLDHHGYCQAHGWMSKQPCPHGLAQEILKRINKEGSYTLLIL